MPAKVSVRARATVTAGLANEVDDVNQYALVMNAATAIGSASGRYLTVSRIVVINPNVAMTSPSPSPSVGRVRAETSNTGRPNIAWASQTPQTAPPSCATA